MSPDGIQDHISAKLQEITVFITSLKNMAGLFICPIVFFLNTSCLLLPHDVTCYRAPGYSILKRTSH
jgi:hypothetical protein